MSATADPAHNAKVMNRFDLTKRLVGKLKHDEAVIGGIGNANFDLWASGQRPQNFYMLGSMGLTIPIALGVAIAQPQAPRRRARRRRLAADAARLPRHRRHAGAEESDHRRVGQRHLPDHRRRSRPRAHRAADLVAIARGAGIANSAWAADEERFRPAGRQRAGRGGPSLIAARIDDKPGVGTTDRDPVQIRARFMRGLGVEAQFLAGGGTVVIEKLSTARQYR